MDDMCSSECMVFPFMFWAATPVGAKSSPGRSSYEEAWPFVSVHLTHVHGYD
ncbi:1981_t:CDS:2 [Gigaspora rosea]|nr:1981_t:CDS:2 [Gigaspora rosea]